MIDEIAQEPVDNTAIETSAQEEDVKQEEIKEESSLTGMSKADEETDKGKITKSVPEVQTTQKEEYEFDSRLYNEDGTFNKDGAKEFLAEQKEAQEKYEKRILDLRRKVSDGKAPDKKDVYFQDFAPADEKYMPFFDKDTPEETQEAIRGITDKLAERYHDSALTQRQADDMSNAVLDIMAETGILDTRTKEEKYIARQEWIESQKKSLGANADNIIRTTRHFVENTHLFDATTKNSLIDLMETQGAPMISALHQIAEGRAGEMPVNVSGLGGLASDIELKAEYLRADTSLERRDEISRQRAMAGRKGLLMQAGLE
jgi:hypothetical protein